MNPILSPLLLLAAAAQAPPAQPVDANAGIRMMAMVAGLVLMGYFLFIRPMKQKEQEAKSLMQGLKENDRVVTIGGIHGVVTNVQRDAERVTIRVDESTGTKIKLNMSAIARIVTGDESETAGASGNKT